MGMFIFTGGIVGSAIGTFLTKVLRQTGNVDVTIRICYVVLLTIVGTTMLVESLTRNIGEEEVTQDRTWLDRILLRLPFPTQFETSGVTTSALGPLLLGTLVGMLAAIMGVGGGFLLIPAMTFLLHMPMRVVVGTSLFQMLFTSSATTIMQATVNHNVDILLAISLLVGSSVGAQLGARVGRRLSGQQQKILLAILVLAISLKMFIDLMMRPARFLVERGGH